MKQLILLSAFLFISLFACNNSEDNQVTENPNFFALLLNLKSDKNYEKTIEILKQLIPNYDHRILQLPVDESTVINFNTKYHAKGNTYDLLNAINPKVNESLWIKKDHLINLMAKDTAAKYVCIHLVQVSSETGVAKLGNLSKHVDNLYFYFTLTDAKGIILTKDASNHAIAFDLDSSLSTLIELPNEVFQRDTSYFDTASPVTKRLKNGLSSVPGLPLANTNTEKIYCEFQEMKSYLLAAHIKDPNFKYIKLEFTQVDTSDANIQKDSIGYNRLKNNNNHFSVFWHSFNKENKPVQDLPVYDVNDLCPNNCPK